MTQVINGNRRKKITGRGKQRNKITPVNWEISEMNNNQAKMTTRKEWNRKNMQCFLRGFGASPLALVLCSPRG